MDWKKTLVALANRFKEPSSWGGLMGFAVLAGIYVPPGMVQAITFIGAGVCGLIAIMVPESAK